MVFFNVFHSPLFTLIQDIESAALIRMTVVTDFEIAMQVARSI